MADPPSGRRRASSSVSSRVGHTRGLSKAIPQPNSSHTSDEFLKAFLDPSFDPASYLNTTLPPLARRPPPNQFPPDSVPLAELSTQAQTLLSQLNAHTTRLSNTLTLLTDDILRSGSRLAYKVELLRGETLSLTETMNESLQDDINKFVPEGLGNASDAQDPEPATSGRDGKTSVPPTDSPVTEDVTQTGASENDPEFIKKLQTLTLVHERLESVIKTFGDAMEFVFPPSEVSVGSGFLSVSAPDPGSEKQSSEQKGQEVLRNLRNEIQNLLTKTPDPVDGIAKALARVEELKDLTSVWKGTAEEKGRNKFIESLAKMVEDRHRELTKEMEQTAKREGKGTEATRARKGSVTRDGAGDDSKAPGGFGLISQLQRLRTGL